MVLLSIGVRPETTLAKAAGLKIGETGGIWVDDYLQTSATDVYAAGDAIEFPHPLTGKPWLNYLANPANRQGRIAADNMVFGNTTKYEGAIGTSIAKVFDMTVASTGLAAKRLKQSGIPYASSTTHSASHAGYYPDALPLTIKLTFDPASGKLYGGQCVGYEGVDKRIDQIALIIKNGGTVYDLMKVEHTYAPPFSSAKDPIAIAGYTANNIISGAMPIVTWRQIAGADLSDILLLDVRIREEHAFGAIPGSVNIPLEELRSRLGELPYNKAIYVYCAVGLRGYLAVKILSGHGFRNVKNLSGGYKTYSTAIEPIVTRTAATAMDRRMDTDTRLGSKRMKTLRIDACGLQCPGPVMKIKQAIDSITEGERIEMVATDAGFSRDAQAWCDTTGNRLISNSEEKGKYTVIIEKGSSGTSTMPLEHDAKGKTLIMFSDDLDKALATFVLANGNDILHLLGIERHQENRQTEDEKGHLRTHVRHDAAVVIAQITPFENEYVRDRQPDDAPHHEAERNRLARNAAPAGYRQRRRIHRLPDVDGRDGRPARRIAGQRDRRRCRHLHGACRKSEREPIHLNPL